LPSFERSFAHRRPWAAFGDPMLSRLSVHFLGERFAGKGIAKIA